MLQGTIRRSVTIPSSLDNKISLMADEYNYKVKNDMIIEFLENGILKLNSFVRSFDFFCYNKSSILS